MIINATAIALLLEARTSTSGYLPMKVFSFRNAAMSMLLFLLTMIFNSANAFVAAFARLATPINNVHSASLSGWAAAGCFVGLLLSVLMIIRNAIRGKVTVQATIVAMKEITGTTVALLLATAGFTLILPYRKRETT